MSIHPQLESEYTRIREALLHHHIRCSQYKEIGFGIQFSILANKQTGLLRLYYSERKGITIDYSQLKGGISKEKIQAIIEGKDVPTNADVEITSMLAQLPMIGMDESGKGDFFGSLVCAAVCVTEESLPQLKQLGIEDSKKLTDKKNITLAEKIESICKGYFAVVELVPIMYNTIYSQLTNEKKNLNHLLAQTHAQALEDVLSRINCKYAIADQFGNESLIKSSLQEKGKNITLIQLPRAESTHIAVAAASILARARFLRTRTAFSNKFNLKFPKGASKKTVDIGKEFVKTFGKEHLGKVAKLHFSTTKKVLG